MRREYRPAYRPQHISEQQVGRTFLRIMVPVLALLVLALA